MKTETEHPEDREIRLQAENEAKRTIGPFWRGHWKEFVSLVQSYADDDAQESFENLREKFWANNGEIGDPPQGAS